MCALDSTTPQLYAVSRPYVTLSGNAAARTLAITGQGFGTSGLVTLDGTAVAATFNAPNASGISTINVVVPTNFVPGPGPKQLKITAANGQSTINGLTIHVLGTGYNPTVLEVGPGRTLCTGRKPPGLG